MAWESRERGGLYYTRSRRVDGRVVREYVGTGPFAQLCARSDEVLRAEREQRRLEERWEREKLEALSAPVLEVDEAAAVLVRASLVAAGYHRHKGEWRRERVA
jgi:hypothetical protein